MIKIVEAIGFSWQEKVTLIKAERLANGVIAGAAFRDQVLAHKKLDGTPGFDECDDTPEQVYQKFMAAWEKGGDITVALETPPWWNVVARRKEVARETEKGPVFNALKFPCGGVPGVADTLTHEFAHGAGFGHSYKKSAKRDNSAPYRIGAIVGELAALIEALGIA